MRVSVKRAIAEAVPVEVHMRDQTLIAYDPVPVAIILAASRDWLLARRLDGFDPHGYIAIFRDHVNFLHTTKHRAFRKAVLQAEGEWQEALRSPAIDLESSATILRALQKLGNFAIVLCETYVDWHSIHCRIVAVNENYATLHGFDGDGQWEGRPKRVDISDITRIYFGSRYLELYRKYAAPSSSSKTI